MKRIYWLVPALTLALFALSLAHPGTASAAADYRASADELLKGALPTTWFLRLQEIARSLYIGLFTIELIVVGVQGLLHKDNLAEFFQTFVFKIVMATLMIAVIGNASSIFPVVVSLFKQTATQTINDTCSGTPLHTAPAPGSTPGTPPPTPPPIPPDCQRVNDVNPTDLEGTFLKWGISYFTAADISRAVDSAASSAAGIMVFGTGLPGLSTAFLMGHANFEIFCIALGTICWTACGAVLLTYLLLTFECQIIMMIGVFFLAFQGSRFTAQFAQGYMSYCVNIGVKFFVFFFVVAILQTMTNDSSLSDLLLSLAAGAAIPFGAGSIAVVAATSPVPIISVISGVLVAAIPNFAGSLLSGSSALSAGAAMGQLTGALSNASATNASFDQQKEAAHQKSDSAQAKHDLRSNTDGGAHGGSHHQPETPQPAPVVAIGPPPPAAPPNAGDASDAGTSPASNITAKREGTWHAGGNAYGPTKSHSSNEPLTRRDADEIRQMKPSEVYDAARHTDWADLKDAQKSAIKSDPALREAASDAYDAKDKDASKALKASQNASSKAFFGGMTLPPEQPPTAVQVRVTNPDKL